MSNAESALREFFTAKLAADETLLNVAYGVTERSGAGAIGRLLTASSSSWLGGALTLDDGWAVGSSSGRLLFVPVRRARQLLRRGAKLQFGELVCIEREALVSADLGFSRERDGSVRLRAKLPRHRLAVRFQPAEGFTDNLRQAQLISEYVAAARQRASS